MSTFLTAAFYKFVDLPDYVDLQAPLLAFCEAQNVKGTILLAREGINSTIAGPAAGVHAVLAHLRSDHRLADLIHKEASADSPPFYRMKVRLKREIVTMGVPEVNPGLMAGTYVKPEQWNALIADPDVVVIDTRNDYEVSIGTFTGAVNPHIKRFADLPEWIRQNGELNARSGKKPKVAMFCTGGIRCEKSTALMRTEGFDEVYHLEGGILKYLEQNSLWQGECFVFDERVSVGHGLIPGHHDLCRSCREPVSAQDKNSPLYELGVSCPKCHDTKTEAQKQGARERQRQVELAARRQQAHIGARLVPKHHHEENKAVTDPALRPLPG